MLVFIMMLLLLVTLDQGLKASTEFGPHTKTTFWVGGEAITENNIIIILVG